MKRLILLVAAALIAGPVYAIGDSAGTNNGAFLKIPTDARGVVLGATMVSMVDGVDGMRWNPASLGGVDSNEFSATHVQYYQNVAIENISYAYPLDEGSLAANVFYLSAGDLDGRDINGTPTGNFKFYDLVGGLGYGRRLRSLEEGMGLYLGGQLKMVQEKIADTSTLNPALDAGVIVVPSSLMRLGLSLRNLSGGGKADFPKEITGGASYTFFRVLTGGFAATYATDAPIRYSVSGEYAFHEFQESVLRVGYKTHDSLQDSTNSQIKFLRDDSLAGLTMGAGFQYRPPQFKTLNLKFDYGLAPFGALGISHTITVKVEW